MEKSKYTVINERDNSEIDHDWVWFHGPPETNMVSTYKDAIGDAFRTIWILVSQDNLIIKVREF